MVYLAKKALPIEYEIMSPSLRSKGQVSIFLVLVFQVLFVFFAMMVNIGLLVYYKINLQNSVDLSAYYAGMKQAEMLNTIAHINYQLRQNWKLFSYRTVLLGTLGPDSHIAHRKDDNTLTLKNPSPPPEDFWKKDGEYRVPIFCMTINDIYRNELGANTNQANENDNQCKKTDSAKLKGFSIPQVVYTLSAHNAIMRGGAIALQDQILTEHLSAGLRNFMILAGFITNFRADSLNRRKVIGVLANTLSNSNQDFYDLDNTSVKDAARILITKNLADQNAVTLSKFELYNSLAHEICKGSPINFEQLPGWLKEIDINSTPYYFDSLFDDPNSNQEIDMSQDMKAIGGEETSKDDPQNPIPRAAYNDPQLLAYIRQLIPFLNQRGHTNDPNNRWTPTVGVEKNPWCMPYVGIKAETSPRLPFLPKAFAPKLIAKAYSKPFGAKIGPWYSKTWPKGNIDSGKLRDMAIDRAMGDRLTDNSALPEATDLKDRFKFTARFSRYPGDDMGFLSDRARWAYGQFYWLYDLQKTPFSSNMWTKPFREGFDKNGDTGGPFYRGPRSGDILADPYNPENFPPDPAIRSRLIRNAVEMRKSEIAAIAPDLFDVTYYTIEPRFDHVLNKLKTFVKAKNTVNPDLMVRGDFGWRENRNDNYNVERQVEQFKDFAFFKKTSEEIFQTVSDVTHLLTSWAEKSIVSYDPIYSNSKIASCEAPLDKDETKYPWTIGACLKGGRSAFSVKLVSKKFLEGTITDIGGEGVSGTILNPPPSNEDF